MHIIMTAKPASPLSGMKDQGTEAIMQSGKEVRITIKKNGKGTSEMVIIPGVLPGMMKEVNTGLRHIGQSNGLVFLRIIGD